MGLKLSRRIQEKSIGRGSWEQGADGNMPT